MLPHTWPHMTIENEPRTAHVSLRASASQEPRPDSTGIGEAVVLGPYGTPVETSFTSEDVETVNEMQDIEVEPMLTLDAA